MHETIKPKSYSKSIIDTVNLYSVCHLCHATNDLFCMLEMPFLRLAHVAVLHRHNDLGFLCIGIVAKTKLDRLEQCRLFCERINIRKLRSVRICLP